MTPSSDRMGRTYHVNMAIAADPVSSQEIEVMRSNPSPTAHWTTVVGWYRAGRITTRDELNALVTETWSFARSPARDAGMSPLELVQMFRTAVPAPGRVPSWPGASRSSSICDGSH